ncbi:MAG: hypothetical protein EA402_13865 [Planctomycetota bacterium]|nr:MAG: hypothetical protein EA402_13865 [Planctomycetota bacterium]
MSRQDDYHDEDEELLDDELVDEEGQEEDDGDREVVAAWSGWGISLAMHAIVFLLLAFVVIAGRLIDDPVPVRPAVIEPPPPPPEEEKEERELTEVDVTIVAEVEVETPVVTQLDVEVEEISTEDEEVSEVAEAKGREEAVSSSETGGSGAFMAIGAGGGAAGAFGNRSGGGRKRALGAYGGSRASESAVDAALRWFARHQSPNGMWDVTGYPVNCDLPGPKCEPGTERTGPDGDAAATGYAVLAFLGAGYDHRTPNRFRRTVRAGLDWIVENQLDSGGWGSNRNYENGIVAMAIAEAFAMTQDPSLREPAQKAIDHLLSRQAQDGGYGLGWDYTAPKPDRNDSSVSGWVVMALKSAEAGGLNIGNGMDGARNYLVRAWNDTNNQGQGITDPYTHRSGFPYTWNASSGGFARENRTAIGLCMGVFLGKGEGNIMMETMANDVMHRAFESREAYYQVSNWPVNTYYLYYNTLGIFQVGGERWQKWNNTVRDLLVNNQRKSDDCFDGSWDFEGTSFHGHRIGRLVSTAYCALSLQVYYRYVPINQAAGGGRR